VQVLDGEEDRAGPAEQLEQREQALEQPALARGGLLVGAGAGAAELRQQVGERVARRDRDLVVGEPARQRAQRRDERCVGDLRAAQLEALAEQDAGAAVGRAGFELAQQPGLADAGLAADEDERRAPLGGPAEAVGQELQLRCAADEDGGGEAARHPFIVANAQHVTREVARLGGARGESGAAGRPVRAAGGGVLPDGGRSPAAEGCGSGATERAGVRSRGSAGRGSVRCSAAGDPRADRGERPAERRGLTGLRGGGAAAAIGFGCHDQVERAVH
jgi:hypothetical protein